MRTCEYCNRNIKADANTVTTMTGCVYHETCYEAARINAMAGRYTGQCTNALCPDCGDVRDTSYVGVIRA